MSEFTCTLWSKSIASSADIVLAGEQQEDAKVGNSSDFLRDPMEVMVSNICFSSPKICGKGFPNLTTERIFFKWVFLKNPPTRYTYKSSMDILVKPQMIWKDIFHLRGLGRGSFFHGEKTVLQLQWILSGKVEETDSQTTSVKSSGVKKYPLKTNSKFAPEKR